MQEVKRRYQAGESQRKIASSVNLHRKTVAKYLQLDKPQLKASPKNFIFQNLLIIFWSSLREMNKFQPNP